MESTCVSDTQISLITAPSPFPSPSTSSSWPLTRFLLFPRLPTELRLKIWACTITPRTLEFHHDPATNRFRTRGHPIPVVLHISRESRAEGLAHYALAFRTPADNNNNSSSSSSSFPRHCSSSSSFGFGFGFGADPADRRAFDYVAFDRDALHVPAQNLFQTLQQVLSGAQTRASLERVRWLVLDEFSMLLHYGGPGVVFDGHRLARLLRKCRSLQGFVVRAGVGPDCALGCEYGCRELVRVVYLGGDIRPPPREDGWFREYVKTCLEEVWTKGAEIPWFRVEGLLGRGGVIR
jgi:hypothetical protein